MQKLREFFLSKKLSWSQVSSPPPLIHFSQRPMGLDKQYFLPNENFLYQYALHYNRCFYIPINPDFNFFYSQAQRAFHHLYLEAILIVLLLSSQQYIHKYFQTF